MWGFLLPKLIMKEMSIIAEYRVHTIQTSDTLHQIATQELHNTDRWTQLIQLNHLEYPYLVKTEKEKDRNPMHLLAPGDKLRLPETNNIHQDLLSHADLKSSQGEHTYDSIMGMDLDLGFSEDPSDNNMSGSNFGDGSAYLKINDKGTDVARVSGIHNLLQSLTVRLITQEGSIDRHPYFGSRLNQFIGQPIRSGTVNSLRMDIETEIKRAIKTDGRIKDVKIPYCNLYNENFFAEVVITPIAPYSAFQMLVNSINGNHINVSLDTENMQTEMK